MLTCNGPKEFASRDFRLALSTFGCGVRCSLLYGCGHLDQGEEDAEKVMPAQLAQLTELLGGDLGQDTAGHLAAEVPTFGKIFRLLVVNKLNPSNKMK